MNIDLTNVKFDLSAFEIPAHLPKPVTVDEELSLIQQMVDDGGDPELIHELIEKRATREEQKIKYKEEHDKMVKYASEKVGEQTEEDFKQIEHDYFEADKHIPQFFVNVNMLYVPCQINGQYIEAFIDTGAQITIMNLKTAKRCGLAKRINTKRAHLLKGVGEQISLGEIYNVDILFGTYIITCNFTVMEGEHDIMFGLNTMKCHRIQLDFSSNDMKIPTSEKDFLKIKFLKPHELKK